MKKVLIGSPIHQSKDILNEFLSSLERLDKHELQVDYYFVDDNIDTSSSVLLEEFQEDNDNVTIVSSNNLSTEYVCDDFTHRWNSSLVEKVTQFKNNIIDFAIDKDYDYLFFIDSDIILHPKTLNKLISDEKDIISNVFFTQWSPGGPSLPQVWLQDAYSMHDFKANENTPVEDIMQKEKEFIESMKIPGVYKVGGLGACTLISKKALSSGVNFNPMYNVSFWGEDRAFCLRAVALGFTLYVDTYYPAYHIYRKDDLKGVGTFIRSSEQREGEILALETKSYIQPALEKINTYSYKEKFDISIYEPYLSENMRKYLEYKASTRGDLSETNLIHRCKIEDWDMRLYNGNTKAIVRMKAIISGYKKNQSFYNEYDAMCSLSINSDNKFSIDEFLFGYEIPLEKKPIVRRISENPKLTLSMIVKNEENRYLKQVLESCKEFIDEAVIIDDNSTDNTIQLCKDILKDIPLKIVENSKSQFGNEINIRKQQWFETIITNPEWILFLDADEIFENRFKYEVRNLMHNIDVDAYTFRLYDFWNDTHYRDDKLWYAHSTYRPFMIRYQRGLTYIFKETAQHCGRMPQNILDLPYKKSDLRLKHLGWSKKEDREEKYKRYMKLDPNGVYGSMLQYQSILDQNPNIVKWQENEKGEK